MMSFEFKAARLALGLTQSDLAYRSQVSLPTIQNIESGSANPAMDTVSSILKVLGFEMHLVSKTVNWEYLSLCGAPLMTKKSSKIKPTCELLIDQLTSACRAISQNACSEREIESVQSLLLGLKSHFPSVYKKYFSGVLFESVLPKKNTGRLIRLKRQSVAVLASYL